MNQNLIEQLNTILQNASPEVQKVILEGHIDQETITLGEKYALRVDETVALKNIILLTLLGVIPTNEVEESLSKDVHLQKETMLALLHDIDSGIFEKARISLFGQEHEEGQEMRTITLGDDAEKDALREQIMAKTERESAIKTSPIENLAKPPQESEDKKPNEIPGSRNELLEQLNVLNTIPTTEEVEERLSKIRAEIAHIEEEKVTTTATEDTSSPEQPMATMAPEKEKINFPTHYNIDPYREIPS
jgi:hypothetical protein